MARNMRTSPRVTLANLNAQMKHEGIDATLFKGAGYFYFSSDNRVSIPSIYVYSLKQMTFSEWMEHIRQAVNEAQ